MFTEMLTEVFIDIFIDSSIDVSTDMLIDMLIDMLTDKEGGGRKEWTSLKSNNPTPTGGEKQEWSKAVP